MVNEAAIVQRVISGDVAPFSQLVERYQKPLFVFVRNLLGESHICEDLVQETFFAAYKNLAAFDEQRSAFSTWLFTIARNKSLNELRSRKRRERLTSDSASVANQAISRDDISESELFSSLDKALADLPIEERTTFILIELAGLTAREVAQMDELKESSVRSRLSRGRAKLREILDLHGGKK